MTTERDRALQTALGQIERAHGKGAIMRLGDVQAQHIDIIPTGALTLDIALGVGGIPRGRIVEIYGPESSGKTTLTLHIIAEAQRRGGVAAFIDAEHALDPQYASRIGVNTEELLISQPDTGEQALEIVEVLVRSGAVDVVVIDSVAALVPKAEIDGEMGDSHVGLQARLMSQAMRKLTAAISRSNTSVIFINQLREKIGVMFGNPEVTTGGRALKFYASVRMDIRKIDSIKQGLDVVGSRVKVKVVKNKVAPPFRSAEFDILYNEGISYAGSVLDMAIDAHIIDKSGAWFSYGDMRLGQGRENVRDFLRQNPDLLEEVAAKVRIAALPEPVLHDAVVELNGEAPRRCPHPSPDARDAGDREGPRSAGHARQRGRRGGCSRCASFAAPASRRRRCSASSSGAGTPPRRPPRRCAAAPLPGYVDDAAMAVSVAARHRRAGHGRARVAADLRAKGVAAELITEALDGQNDTEEAAALAVAQQFWERTGTSGSARSAGAHACRGRAAAARLLLGARRPGAARIDLTVRLGAWSTRTSVVPVSPSAACASAP